VIMFLCKSLREIRDRTNHRLVLLSVNRLLEYTGIEISLYYLTREVRAEGLGLSLEPEITLSGGFLSPEEVRKLYQHPEIKKLGAEADRWLAEGCLCFACKHKEEVIAYSWCDLQRCNSRYVSFPLQPDEAYLFRARTFQGYRGRNLAPYLRYELYKSLDRLGRSRFYSITEYLNASAIAFKNKLKARPVKLCLYLGFFGHRAANLTLKRYPA